MCRNYASLIHKTRSPAPFIWYDKEFACAVLEAKSRYGQTPCACRQIQFLLPRILIAGSHWSLLRSQPSDDREITTFDGQLVMPCHLPTSNDWLAFLLGSRFQHTVLFQDTYYSLLRRCYVLEQQPHNSPLIRSMFHLNDYNTALSIISYNTPDNRKFHSVHVSNSVRIVV